MYLILHLVLTKHIEKYYGLRTSGIGLVPGTSYYRHFFRNRNGVRRRAMPLKCRSLKV